MQMEDIQKPGPSSGAGGGGAFIPPSGGPGNRPTSANTTKSEVPVLEESETEVGDMILVGISYIILVLLFPLAIFQAIQVHIVLRCQF